MPGNIQDQVGQGSEQPHLVEDFPAHCKGVRIGELCRFFLTQTDIWFYDFNLTANGETLGRDNKK